MEFKELYDLVYEPVSNNDDAPVKPGALFWYWNALIVHKERISEENIIASDPILYSPYCKHFNISYDELKCSDGIIWEALKQTTPEQAIALKHPLWACLYAIFVLKGRFEAAEALIMTDARAASVYAIDVLKSRWEEAENVIAKNANAAYWYARDILKFRWEEAESAIAKNGYIACLYALDIVKARFEAGEDAISKDSKPAYFYVRDILKKRWRQAENAIADDLGTLIGYCRLFGLNRAFFRLGLGYDY